MLNVFNIWFFGVIIVTAVSAQPSHLLKISQSYVVDSKRELMSDAGYMQINGNITMGAKVLAVWDVQEKEKTWSGLSVNLGLVRPVGKSYLIGNLVLGNIKNCWQYGVETLFMVPLGNASFISGRLHYSFLYDAESGTTIIPAIGLGYNYRIL
jgi:hypothetical protein